MTQLDVFVDRPLSRVYDRETSKQAATQVRPHVSELQRHVLEAFKECGPMTAGECERLPRFLGLAPSTIRKRISELSNGNEDKGIKPLLKSTGLRRDGMTVWEVA